MSATQRQIQLFVNPEQYAELEREAGRTGRSVASLIRESIVEYLANHRSSSAAAAGRLLSSADSTESPEAEWTVTKAALEQDLVDKLPGR